MLHSGVHSCGRSPPWPRSTHPGRWRPSHSPSPSSQTFSRSTVLLTNAQVDQPSRRCVYSHITGWRVRHCVPRQTAGPGLHLPRPRPVERESQCPQAAHCIMLSFTLCCCIVLYVLLCEVRVPRVLARGHGGAGGGRGRRAPHYQAHQQLTVALVIYLYSCHLGAGCSVTASLAGASQALLTLATAALQLLLTLCGGSESEAGRIPAWGSLRVQVTTPLHCYCTVQYSTGLLGGTRAGSVDAALLPLLSKTLSISPEAVLHLLNTKSGFLGRLITTTHNPSQLQTIKLNSAPIKLLGAHKSFRITRLCTTS